MNRTAAIPVRDATVEICAGECGAQCCRAPGRFSMDRPEFDRILELARQLGVERWMVNQDVDPNWFVADHADNGGHCVFLDDATNLCRIYHQRPSACVKYPTRPEPRCRLWVEG